MAEEKRKNLGRGLSALMGEDRGDNGGEPTDSDNAKGSRLVPVERLLPGRYQPRHSVDEEKISELAQSIRENGIIQPLLVRRQSEDKDSFEIIAGERRWRAAQMAKLHEVPVIIRDLSDQEALEMALVENLQRQDLSSLARRERSPHVSSLRPRIRTPCGHGRISQPESSSGRRSDPTSSRRPA